MFALFAACAAATTALAHEKVGADLGRVFADCAGRHSAETEHAWLTAPGQETEARLRRDRLSDLAAPVERDPVRRMASQVAAKAAQRGLLARAAFAGDAEAARRAEAYRAACDRPILGS